MPGLLDHRGNPIQNKKTSPPIVGEKFGQWSGRGLYQFTLPGGGIVQFDLDKLTLADYRAMTSHYQVNSSLSVLSFMLHQSNWTIECDNKKIRDLCTEQLTNIWTQLNRSLSQAHWAGYSPNVLQWENDVADKSVVLTKIKDLIPETCAVNWKEVDGYAPPGTVPPKIPVYNGIIQFGWPRPIPVDNTFWFPMLMENGNYYGKKLLKSAYTSYFFSMLLHLYANRYYERFGEPTPVGRAPFGERVDLPDGTSMNSSEFMLMQLMQLRNRSVVVLPGDRGEDAAGRGFFEYDLEYLEAQMRGADFERYMQRLDEEISLAIFTPVLLMKTADVGSYNLGVGHMQMYLWMLNALNADRAQYIDKYILAPMAKWNYPGMNPPKVKIKFNKLDNTNAQLLEMILQALIGKDKIKFDVEQLGEMAGMTISEIQQTTAPQTQDPVPASDPKSGKPVVNPAPPSNDILSARDIQAAITTRTIGQVENAFREDRFGPDLRLNFGFKRRMEEAFTSQGIMNSVQTTNRLYAKMDNWARDITGLGTDYIKNSEEFKVRFTQMLDSEISRVTNAN